MKPALLSSRTLPRTCSLRHRAGHRCRSVQPLDTSSGGTANQTSIQQQGIWRPRPALVLAPQAILGLIARAAKERAHAWESETPVVARNMSIPWVTNPATQSLLKNKHNCRARPLGPWAPGSPRALASSSTQAPILTELRPPRERGGPSLRLTIADAPARGSSLRRSRTKTEFTGTALGTRERSVGGCNCM